MEKKLFTSGQLETVNTAAGQAEELVSGYYKMSSSQWLRNRYEIRTAMDLNADERVDGPFAQIVKYGGIPENSSLGSGGFDLFRICIQDGAVLEFAMETEWVKLYPFLLYIITHELVHIVRFGQFEQFFHVGEREKNKEEIVVHEITGMILCNKKIDGLDGVIAYFNGAE